MPQRSPALRLAVNNPGTGALAVGTSARAAREDHPHGAAAAFQAGGPASKSLTLGTGVQAADPTKPATITVNLTSTANFSLAGGTTNSAEVVIGTSKANVEAGTGFKQSYSNSVTGTI